jgi:cysteine desulfurase
MLANNEIGSVNPIAEIAEAVKRKKKDVLIHCDAVQGSGKIPFDVEKRASIWRRSRRTRCTGPRASARCGCGASRACASSRSSTAAATSAACARARSTCRASSASAGGRAAQAEMADEARAGRAARPAARRIQAQIPETYVNGSLEHRLPGNMNISFAFVEGEGLMMALKDVAVSSGSACTSASLEPSYVLRALGVGEELAHTSIRFGLGRFNTEEEVDYVVKLVVDKVTRLRELSPLWEMHQEGVDLKSIEWTAH